MVNYVSPGVYTIEKDISEYTPSINTSIVGIVGFAGKGPTNKATLITSQNNLISTFGSPTEALLGQALEGSLEILEQTNSMYFIRAAASTATDASANMIIGTCPSVIVSGSTAVAGGYGVLHPLTLRIQAYDNAGISQYADNAGVGKDFSIPAGTAVSQAEALRKVIGGGLDSDKVGIFDGGSPVGSLATGLGLSGAIVGSYAGSGASISVSACTGTTFSEAAGISILYPASGMNSAAADYGASAGSMVSACRAYGSTYLSTGAVDSASYKVESLHPGAGYNAGLKTDGTTSGNSITVSRLGSQNFGVNVNQDGTTDETFKCSLVGSGAFLEDIINTGETNTTSNLIKGNLIKNNADISAAKLSDFGGKLGTLMGTTDFSMTTQFLSPLTNPYGTGTPVASIAVAPNGARWNKLVTSTATNLTDGSNGDESGTADAALIGDASVEPKTGMQGLDDNTLNIGIALVPGIQSQSVQNALITLAETTQNFLALVSPPVAIGTVQDAIDWSNGKSSSTAGSRTAPINSSYAAIYWPWVKVFSTFDGLDRWLDPAIYGARQMAYTDGVADSWFAPAGYRRGRLTKPTEVEVKLNQGDRDSMYSGGNVVNPIVAFPQQGITIFGQRTTQRSPTALDRINVRRLMIYIRKVIVAATQRFVFEPNDQFTWSQIEGVLNPFLDDIRRRRGITEFRVVCDETTNTPLRVDRNELWTKVLIKPTKTAEILIFEINLTNQSAQLGSL